MYKQLSNCDNKCSGYVYIYIYTQLTSHYIYTQTSNASMHALVYRKILYITMVKMSANYSNKAAIFANCV